MTEDTVSATTTISASAETVFTVLADPSQHAAIDGTGWVCEPLDGQRLTGSGQIFRVAMYHPNHPEGSYEMANQVLAFEPPRVISWKPGYASPETGKLEFGGWMWRYDLTQLGPDKTKVTLSYDWSSVGPIPRQRIHFPAVHSRPSRQLAEPPGRDRCALTTVRSYTPAGPMTISPLGPKRWLRQMWS
jgi:uncharacterized protein YndB with AHSA1/START domain